MNLKWYICLGLAWTVLGGWSGISRTCALAPVSSEASFAGDMCLCLTTDGNHLRIMVPTGTKTAGAVTFVPLHNRLILDLKKPPETADPTKVDEQNLYRLKVLEPAASANLPTSVIFETKAMTMPLSGDHLLPGNGVYLRQICSGTGRRMRPRLLQVNLGCVRYTCVRIRGGSRHLCPLSCLLLSIYVVLSALNHGIYPSLQLNLGPSSDAFVEDEQAQMFQKLPPRACGACKNCITPALNQKCSFRALANFVNCPPYYQGGSAKCGRRFFPPIFIDIDSGDIGYFTENGVM